MREIVLDTETTGFNPEEGHRIIEIGAIEIINRLPTGNTFHKYINPEREIDASAIRVHGITNEKVARMPVFADIAQEFSDFVANSPLVAHNAKFDINFLNHEFMWAELEKPANDVVDTLTIARQKFPGSQVSLDALCRRFEVDLSGRTLHGALLDAELLATVYLELTGGQQPALALAAQHGKNTKNATAYKKTEPQPPRQFSLSEVEKLSHQTFIDDIENNFWPDQTNSNTAH